MPVHKLTIILPSISTLEKGLQEGLPFAKLLKSLYPIPLER